ncbi:uncharacterized protein LOC123443065 isoform X2 [Hordeum vulgare subsp. vulgare]|uniref:Predicted protein n=1 Tax=Hordeum vulgare subsp. vulgare TaxID=112509 RepID=F2DA02_HORVV|nr:uncharacterized protein LOC123443065 isoform X2 [Hordeum vulgare subsp. vulgare]BAJ91923.1 predicted protein [Hordeum vulgare subsp. vulgare]BAJ93126.1 predicted protein [Hordeum vulgare subsp. vulgare]
MVIGRRRPLDGGAPPPLPPSPWLSAALPASTNSGPHPAHHLDPPLVAEMEGKAVGFSAANCGADATADDFEYITGMSTILVATIQEVKDRVSQMEFIFCSQIFPHFQAKSKLLHARLADSTATREAEDEWRQKEAGLLRQLEELSRGKRRAEDRLLQLESSLEEMRGRLLDAERLAAEHGAEKKQLLGRLEEEMKKDEVVHRFEREIGEKDAEISRERLRRWKAPRLTRMKAPRLTRVKAPSPL